MDTINADFRFNSVGQGLFYSGIISKGSDRFVIVYDCGTRSKTCFMDAEIKSFVDTLPSNSGGRINRKIDLLTISHFDDDHVNGLVKLFSQHNFTVDTVVIPYISIYKRLALASSATYGSSLHSFYSDVISYLSTFGAKRIFIILDDGSVLDDEDKGYRFIEEYGDGIDLDALEEYHSTTGKALISIVKSKLFLRSSKFFWRFKFFNHGHKNSIDAELKNIMAAIGVSLEKAFSNRKVLSDIRKEYKKIDTNINNSSVALLHSPTKVSLLSCEGGCIYKSPCETLLTGDLDCDCYYTELENYYKDFQGPIMLVPHHGAEKYWSTQFTYWETYLFVVSYGIANRYGHPSYIVKRDIEFKDKYLKEVTQRNSFSYRICLDT